MRCSLNLIRQIKSYFFARVQNWLDTSVGCLFKVTVGYLVIITGHEFIQRRPSRKRFNDLCKGSLIRFSFMIAGRSLLQQRRNS